MPTSSEGRYTPGYSRPLYFVSLNPTKGGTQSEPTSHSRHSRGSSSRSSGALRSELGRSGGDATSPPLNSMTMSGNPSSGSGGKRISPPTEHPLSGTPRNLCICGHKHRRKCRAATQFWGPCGCLVFVPADICRRCNEYVPPPVKGEWAQPAICDKCWRISYHLNFALRGLREHFTPSRWPEKRIEFKSRVRKYA